MIRELEEEKGEEEKNSEKRRKLTVIENKERKKDCNPLLLHGPLNDGVTVKRMCEPALEDDGSQTRR